MKAQNSFFQNKKTIVSFVLSLLVFYIHFCAFSAFQEAEGFFAYALEQLLILTKVAVPLFFVISAVLFYRNYDLSMTLSKWKSRCFSLLIPYLIWNSIWLSLALLGNYTPLGSVLGGVKAVFSLETLLKGIFLYGYFQPFWFIYELILLTALCPLIYLLLKNKWVGLAGISAYFLAIALGFKVTTPRFPNSDAVLFYLMGAWIGMHHFPDFTKRSSSNRALLGLALCLLCCIFFKTQALLPQWCSSPAVTFLMVSLFSGSAWVAFDLFSMESCPSFMEHSFLMYALHSFLGAAFSTVLRKLLPSLFLTALLSFCLTVLTVCVAGKLLNKLPRLKKILIGR